MKFSDAKPLAYLTDGSGLYEVVSGPHTERAGGLMAAVKRFVLIEDCLIEGAEVRLNESDMGSWELVRPAPEPTAPDAEAFDASPTHTLKGPSEP